MFKPFIPDYIPSVGEVDAFLKMPKPDAKEEDLGITVIDEPALN
jgi:intraflagellar transport protein 46